MSEALNKEQVYDAQINPLMEQILTICQAHGIAMLCTFAIPTPDDDELACTSMLPDETGENHPAHKRAYQAVMQRSQAFAITIASPKESA